MKLATWPARPYYTVCAETDRVCEFQCLHKNSERFAAEHSHRQITEICFNIYLIFPIIQFMVMFPFEGKPSFFMEVRELYKPR